MAPAKTGVSRRYGMESFDVATQHETADLFEQIIFACEYPRHAERLATAASYARRVPPATLP
jgi:hypothetical protein